ncbi:unnamed protein product [Bubo scandiacus]
MGWAARVASPHVTSRRAFPWCRAVNGGRSGRDSIRVSAGSGSPCGSQRKQRFVHKMVKGSQDVKRAIDV